MTDIPAAVSDMKWRPIQEHSFPWEPSELLVACFYIGPESEISPEVSVFGAKCSKGDYFDPQTGFLTLLEQGWTPYDWLDAPLPPTPSENEMRSATEHFRGKLGGEDKP